MKPDFKFIEDTWPAFLNVQCIMATGMFPDELEESAKKQKELKSKLRSAKKIRFRRYGEPII